MLIASDRRLARIREYERRADPTVHQLLAEIYEVDWVLVEGFACRRAQARGLARRHRQAGALSNDPFVVAVVTDHDDRPPHPPGCRCWI